MKLRAFRRFNFTADVYDFIVNLNQDGTRTATWSYSHSIKCNIVNNNSDIRSALYTDQPLRTNIKISNIQDKYGNALFAGTVYRITTVDPEIDVFGNRNGFRHRLALTNPVTFVENIQDIVV